MDTLLGLVFFGVLAVLAVMANKNSNNAANDDDDLFKVYHQFDIDNCSDSFLKDD